MNEEEILRRLEEFTKQLEEGQPIQVTQIRREETPDGPMHIVVRKSLSSFIDRDKCTNSGSD